MGSFSRGGKPRRGGRSRSTAAKSAGAAGCCPVTIPYIPEPIPAPSHALELVAAVCQAVEGLAVTVRPVTRAPTVAHRGNAEEVGMADAEGVGGMAFHNMAASGDAGAAERKVEIASGGAGKLQGRGKFGPVARFEVARAAMAIPLEEYRPPPRPPLEAPPATPPPEPLPINGYVWSAIGKTAMVVDGLDLSPNKLRELEELAAKRGASGGAEVEGTVTATG